MAEITGVVPPSKNTIGSIGDIYINTITGQKYELLGIYNTSDTDTDAIPNEIQKEYDWGPVIKNGSPEQLAQIEQNKNDISKLSGEIEALKNGGIGSGGSSSGGQVEVITYERVTDGLVNLDRHRITKISDTSFTIEASVSDYIVGYPVTAGQHIKITASSNNTYIGYGYVWSTSPDTPDVWNGSNAVGMLSAVDHDYALGNATSDWVTTTLELVVPSDAKMIWVRAKGEGLGAIYIGKTESDKENESNELSYQRKTVYEIVSEPIVTTGTVTKQSVYSKENRECYLWEFSEVGSITLNNVQVNAKNTDRVGIWLYINEEALTYGNNTDGVAKIYIDGVVYDDYFAPAYEMVSGWNYVDLGIVDSNTHTVKFDFTMVRGNYKLAIDTIELNHKTRPQILLSFDMSIHTEGNLVVDNRYTLLNERGFRGTLLCNPEELINETNKKEHFNLLLSKGWDWSIYGGNGTRPHFDNGTLDDWKTYLKAKISSCEEVGLFNPISYFSPENRGSVVLEQALREVGYKVARIGGTNYKINWFDDKNGLYISCIGVGANVTAEEIIAKIDDAIENHASICVFTHMIQDTVTTEYNCSTAVYSAVLDAIKTRVDSGLCDVVTFREFYNHWCPEGYAELMQNRHEKEKQYILSKIV